MLDRRGGRGGFGRRVMFREILRCWIEEGGEEEGVAGVCREWGDFPTVNRNPRKPGPEYIQSIRMRALPEPLLPIDPAPPPPRHYISPSSVLPSSPHLSSVLGKLIG